MPRATKKPSRAARTGGDESSDWAEPPLRFTLLVPGVGTAIIGATDPDNARANVMSADQPNYVAAPLRQLNDNGAWSWFMDERAIVYQGKLLVGSVRSTDAHDHEKDDDPDWGNIELAVHDIESGATDVVVLHRHLEQDDHDGPALHVRAKGGDVLAVYTQHSQERKLYYRIGDADDLTKWGPIREFETPGEDHPPFGGDNVTYSNLFQPASENGRVYNYFRSVQHQQNWMFSDDGGETWHYGGMFLKGHRGYAPYFKYATNGVDEIHFVGTEDHPRNFDNSVYHGVVRGQTIYHSDGRAFGPLSRTTDKSGDIWDLTPVFRGDPDNVAWVVDLHLDEAGNPVCVFSVQKDGRGLPGGQGGMDLRYHYARWDGRTWHQREIAHAGRRLYPNEDDYAGGAALDPQDTGVVYLSTDAHPVTGQPLVSNADGQRHYELFRGRTDDGGDSWAWTPITANSDADNLRPLVPVWDERRTAVVWMRGRYEYNRGPWNTRVVAALL